ncbi:hypothetical protein EVA_10941, partial [gut metagenome]
NEIGENHKEKVLVNKVTVIVALDLGTGNTKKYLRYGKAEFHLEFPKGKSKRE